MATTTTRDTSFPEAPEAPEQTPSRPPYGRRTTVLGAAAVLAAGAAVAVLAIATLGTDTRYEPVGRPAVDQRGNTPAADGSIEDYAGSGPACPWTSEANGPVLPANDIGGPPTPGSVLIFESCDGQLTGTIAWLNPGPERAADQGTGAVPDAGGSDAGLVNPWEAGNAAVDRYLSELDPECVPTDPDPPARC